MILANVRQQLDRSDAQLALRLVGRASDAAYLGAEEALRESGMDVLLDDQRLLTALLDGRQGAHASYALFTYVIVRHALRAVGEHDRVLADYVASVMMHFGLRDGAQRIGTVDDQTYDTLAELSADAESADARRSLLARAHLGNYALWYSGIFPDYIEERRWRRGGPDLDYYEEMGRRGFALASSHRLAGEYGLSLLYSAAGERFATLRVALNAISDSLLFPNRSSPDRLMRQVSNEARWRMQ